MVMRMASAVGGLKTDAQKDVFRELLSRWLCCRKPVLKAGRHQTSAGIAHVPFLTVLFQQAQDIQKEEENTLVENVQRAN